MPSTTAKLVERAEKLDFKTAICYEEKTCFPGWNKISERKDAVAKAGASSLEGATRIRRTVETSI
jgi:hypothetical protein